MSIRVAVRGAQCSVRRRARTAALLRVGRRLEGVTKKEARYVSLASPPHLAGFRHKVTPPKTGGEFEYY